MPFAILCTLVAALLLVAAPGAHDSLFGGTPLTLAGRVACCGLIAAALLAALWPPRARLGPWVPAAIATLAVVKMLAGASAPASGWHAEYRYVDAGGETRDARFYWRWASRDHRVDRRIAFDRDSFDLHFLNSIPHFGYPPYSKTVRQLEFPLHVRWQGALHLQAPASVVLRASADGLLRLAVDGRNIEASTPDRPIALDLPAGPHVVVVEYDKPAHTWPRVQVDLTDGGTGARLPVAADARQPVRPADAAVSTALVVAGLLLAVVGIGRCYRGGCALDVGTVASRVALAVCVVAVTAWTVRLVVGTMGQTAYLHGGGDPLGYASDARAILHDGPLLLQGRPLGQASPFYFYPLYPYVLATVHALVGEDASAIFLLNGVSLMLLPWLFWHLGWKTLDWPAAVVGAVALLVFIGRYCWAIAAFEEPSFTDTLFLPVAMGALVLLTRAFDAPSPARLIAAGALIAMGAANRPSFLMLVGCAPVAFVLTQSARPLSTRVGGAIWLLAGVFVGLLPFTLRNLVASGKFVVLVNSWIQIPYFLIPPEVKEKPVGAPTLVQALGMARDIWLRDPLGTAWLEVRKVVFTLGYGGPGIAPADAAPSSSLSVLTPLFAAALWLRRIPRTVAIVLCTFAVSHLMGMVLAAPWTFGLKTILPIHAAFLFGAAFLLQPTGSAGHSRA